MAESQTTHRRTVLKGAAWSMPVIAVAIAAPQAAASTSTNANSDANYYWLESADAKLTTLDPDASGYRAQFSAQIAYQSNPWASPKPAWVLALTITFSEPVTVEKLPAGWNLVSPKDPSAPGKVFVFHQTPAAFGGPLTMPVVASGPGQLVSTASMSILNGSTVTWSEPTRASAELV